MKFCIIGLGSFGTHLARQLSRDGHEIVAVDNHPVRVNQLKDEIEYLIQADCTDINAFHEIPIDACDAVILAIGEDFEASLTVAANIQQLGAKRIISRIINPLHGRLLKLLKIEELMIPEAMAAAWLARTLKTPDFLNSIEIGGGYEVVQVMVPDSMAGKTLQEVSLRDRYQLNSSPSPKDAARWHRHPPSIRSTKCSAFPRPIAVLKRMTSSCSSEKRRTSAG